MIGKGSTIVISECSNRLCLYLILFFHSEGDFI